MSWPLASHFSAILQNPQLAFRDPLLKQCRIAKNRQNQPRPWAGAFAVVFKGTCPDTGRTFAMRVFTTESPRRRERYDLVSDYLNACKPDCLVDFEYRHDAIRSSGDGKWYPLILMDWVQGETLFHWVRKRCLEGNGPALARAAGRWVELVKQLADAEIAHGDLQHANVMVTPAGQLKLVDYDGMCVPALVGRRNLEVGIEPYQHPDRDQSTVLSAELDRFSSLVIYVALRALAADPSLWKQYVEGPEYDKLLFRGEDFRHPGASPLVRQLGQSPEEDVRDLADRLIELARAPIDRVLPLGEFANSFAKVQRLLEAESWGEAVELLNRRGRFRDAPKQLQPLIERAYEYVCRRQAWAKYRAIGKEPGELNDRKLINAWNETLFAGFEPAERRRPRLMAARRDVMLLDRLHDMIRQASGNSDLTDERNIAVLARRLPADYSFSLRPRAKLAGQRVEAVERLEQLLAQNKAEADIVGGWQAVKRLRSERFLPVEWIGRIELAEKRLAIIETLAGIPENLAADQLDRRLLETWQDDLLEDCPQVDPWRPAFETALTRRKLLRRIEAAIGAGDEPMIVALVEDPLLVDYRLPDRWATSVGNARDQITRVDALLKALQTDDRSLLWELFDARLIRQYADRFGPHERKLCEWVRSEILPVEQLGLGPAVARGSLVPLDRPASAYRVRWTWPQPRFSEECILAVCPQQPNAEDTPADLVAHHRAAVDRASWESGGSSRLIHHERQFGGDYVVVWARVDLGFRSFTSQPLVLGRIENGKGRLGRWKGWNAFSTWSRKRAGSKEDESSHSHASDRSGPIARTDGEEDRR